jgi:hypothetical protein
MGYRQWIGDAQAVTAEPKMVVIDRDGRAG